MFLIKKGDKLLYLSDLRKLYNRVDQVIEKMPITIDFKDSQIFQEGLLEGIEGRPGQWMS